MSYPLAVSSTAATLIAASVSGAAVLVTAILTFSLNSRDKRRLQLELERLEASRWAREERARAVGDLTRSYRRVLNELRPFLASDPQDDSTKKMLGSVLLAGEGFNDALTAIAIFGSSRLRDAAERLDLVLGDAMREQQGRIHKLDAKALWSEPGAQERFGQELREAMADLVEAARQELGLNDPLTPNHPDKHWTEAE